MLDLYNQLFQIWNDLSPRWLWYSLIIFEMEKYQPHDAEFLVLKADDGVSCSVDTEITLDMYEDFDWSLTFNTST